MLSYDEVRWWEGEPCHAIAIGQHGSMKWIIMTINGYGKFALLFPLKYHIAT